MVFHSFMKEVHKQAIFTYLFPIQLLHFLRFPYIVSLQLLKAELKLETAKQAQFINYPVNFKCASR